MESKKNAWLEKQHLQQQVYGTFHLNGIEYAVEMADLQEVVNAPTALQSMPLAPRFLLGLFNLRGQVIPVIDLNVLLGYGDKLTQQFAGKRLAVLRNGGARLGLVFDAIGEVLRVAPEEIAPIDQRNLNADVPKMPIKALICRDNGERLLQVLDLSAILLIHNLPFINQHAGMLDANHHFKVRIQDLYREKLIGFAVGTCSLALEMKCVVAILENKGKTGSPRVTDLCNSIINFRGRMIPVVFTNRLLRIPTTVETPKHILVCRIGATHIGFEVDETTSIIPYAKEKVVPVPVLDDFRSNIFRGCFTDRDGQDFIVLNEEGLLSKEEIVAISLDHRKLIEQAEAEENAREVVARVPLLTFKLGKTYGIRLNDVTEVMTCPPDLVRAPDTPDAVLGVLNLRGTPVSVVDPRQLLRLGEPPAQGNASLLVFQHKSRKIAMRVDSIESIMPVSIGPEDDLPAIFFQNDVPILEETFERGVHLTNKGERCVVLVLTTDQMVERLAEALTVAA